ncbi:SPFH domain-containing protein [Gemmatimonas sp.]|jgi:regulator of protease activity HflC (stomatin/prohibitin superfamily)|uniref:SPFH domain-containing protein n=1 Tax=Gemmatimonas sp. TaxID=1962908 RepID=UPI0037C0565F
MFREVEARPSPGLLMAVLVFALLLGGAFLFYLGARYEEGRFAIGGILLLTAGVVATPGFFTVAPNEGKVLTLFGKYKGTAKTPGLWFTNPFMTKTAISLRIRNFETNKLKVNDARSNPVEIGAIVVWKVIDTAEATFEVNDYVQYVAVQSESAVRALASSYPYDHHGDDAIALSTHPTEISKGLLEALHDRLGKAGVEVLEARISHLAYSPEIAAAMLQRQQASAIVAARQTIVEGAVGMVEMALDALSARQIVTLDDERKASMVSNLLVVLCSDRAAQPVVNTGTLYS